MQNIFECKRCKIRKPRCLFSKNRYHKNGLQNNCKQCNKKYKSANRKQIILQKKAYYRTTKGIAKQLFDKARYRAKKQELKFEIDYDWVFKQVQQNFVCPVRNKKFVTGVAIFNENSRTIDRMCPKAGYTKGNSYLISFKANLVKNNASLKELGC